MDWPQRYRLRDLAFAVLLMLGVWLVGSVLGGAWSMFLAGLLLAALWYVTRRPRPSR